MLGADDQIGKDFFGLMRFVDGEGGGCHFVDFKPRVVERYLFE